MGLTEFVYHTDSSCDHGLTCALNVLTEGCVLCNGMDIIVGEAAG